jgi:excisionase family DNA binding protein
MEDELLDCKEVARRLHVSQPHVYSLLRRGDIPRVRVGYAVRVRPEDLEEYIRKLGSSTQAPPVKKQRSNGKSKR